MTTRLRDHDKGDLALAALTVATTVLTAGWQVGRRVAARLRRRPR